MLLHKNGNSYFMAADRTNYRLPELKPTKFVQKESKFGLSKDSPFHSRYTYIHAMSSSIFDDSYIPKGTYNSFKMQSHAFLQSCVKKAKNSTASFIKAVHEGTPIVRSVKPIFTMLMDKSAPYDQKILESLLNRYNVNKLNSSASQYPDSPYNPKLASYTALLKGGTTKAPKLPLDNFSSVTSAAKY